MIKSIFLLIVTYTLHQYHISNTKIVFNKKEQSLQITMRCFVDDIEHTINTTQNIALELGNDRELKQSNTYLAQYFKQHFKIQINQTAYSPSFLGKEIEQDIIYCYFEIDGITDIKTIEVENTVLFTTFEDQQNIIRLNINDHKKTVVLKHTKTKSIYLLD